MDRAIAYELHHPRHSGPLCRHSRPIYRHSGLLYRHSGESRNPETEIVSAVPKIKRHSTLDSGPVSSTG